MRLLELRDGGFRLPLDAHGLIPGQILHIVLPIETIT